ncbi:MAG: hypothetical protein CBC42_03415 [Betaproteobacteria bacterium TMED82]|mgnify:CR=1 FL=1|nr:MAG: hypothetical protein CBC42_03415 [Betaproteobacteria bacterium TMED82]|tara:strand:+ start:76965 stop:77912 length:948 start_codon:yes stop_codon:yes gene_type:complete
MSKSIIQISGSVAFDTLLQFENSFEEFIIPENIDKLNVSFFCPSMRREYGGCAANIAYNLRLLNIECSILGAIGKDGGEYYDRLNKLGINISHLQKIDSLFTAQALITTDKEGNQITSFHPGAMLDAGSLGVLPVKSSYGIVSPNSYDAMQRHAKEFYNANIPFIFDPGQALPMFSKKDILKFTEMASWIALNEYEADLFFESTGLSLKDAAEILNPHKNGGIVNTLGPEGADIISTNTGHVRVKAVEVKNQIDPTGCGDAFRAGLLFGLNNDYGLDNSVKYGNVLGGIKVETSGGQNHTFDKNIVETIFKNNYL